MALHFNPPPSWPLPRGFFPPPGWQPDPRWPRPPYQWPLWIGVADAPPATVRQETSPADITVDLTSFPAGSGGTARLAPHRYRIAALAVDVFIVVVVFGALAVLGRLAEEALKVDLV